MKRNSSIVLLMLLGFVAKSQENFSLKEAQAFAIQNSVAKKKRRLRCSVS